MKRSVVCTVFVAGLVMTAGLASGAEPTGDVKARTSASPGMPKQGGSQGVPSATRGNERAGYVEAQEAEGRIGAIDEQDGRVTVMLSEGGEVRLRLPVGAAKRFNEGDRVNLRTELSLAERRQPAAPSP